MKHFLFLLLLTFIGCSSAQYEKDHQDNIEFGVDSRVELLTVVQLMADYFLITKNDFKYRKDALAYFDSFKNHPAVLMTKKLRKLGFSYDAPINLMTHLSPPPELKQVAPFSTYVIRRAKGEQNLVEYVEQLRDFAKKSKFMDFFNSNTPYYKKITSVLHSSLGKYNFVNNFASYWGESTSQLFLYFAPLNAGSNFAAWSQDSTEGYSVISCSGCMNSETTLLSSSSMQLLWHEFAHTVVNPITSKLPAEKIQSYDKTLREVKHRAYKKVETKINELIVRATEARFLLRHFGEGEANWYLGYCKNKQGFVHINQVYNLLAKYENNRQTYPRFKDFYPVILKALE